jgi:pyridoxal phosphate enzyme (YggS family)
MANARVRVVSEITAERVGEALAAVRARIDRAGGGRDVEILPVTKGFDARAIEAAIGAGCTAIGENYAQELLAKHDVIGDVPGLTVHFIGQLQTNKVRQLVEVVDVFETVDRARLAREIAKRAPGASVLVQVAPPQSAGSHPAKGGCPLGEVDQLVDLVNELGLELVGFMTVGPTEGGPEAARAGFREVRQLTDRHGLAVCSMGMTDDLEVAVGEGSTQVRVGTALFGSRPRA